MYVMTARLKINWRTTQLQIGKVKKNNVIQLNIIGLNAFIEKKYMQQPIELVSPAVLCECISLFQTIIMLETRMYPSVETYNKSELTYFLIQMCYSWDRLADVKMYVDGLGHADCITVCCTRAFIG